MKVSIFLKFGVAIVAAFMAATFLTSCMNPSMSDSSIPPDSYAETSLSSDARAALNKLTRENTSAANLEKEATGILVFPSVTKAGFMVGGFLGKGVLFKNGEIAGFYETGGGSYGLQAGAQRFGYALFFMSEDALKYIDKTEGFEIGVGPSVVVMDEGRGKSVTTTTGRGDVYAYIFDQKGLMAGMGLQGSKINRVR